MSVPERLKALRLEKGINKKELAKELNLPYTTYVNYEAGTRDTKSDILKILSDYYGVSIDYILGATNEKAKHDDYSGSFIDTRDEMLYYGDLPTEGKKELETYLEFLHQKYGRKDYSYAAIY